MKRTGSWTFVKDPVAVAKAAQEPKKTERKTITKPIGGEKNGKQRVILAKKPVSLLQLKITLDNVKTHVCSGSPTSAVTTEDSCFEERCNVFTFKPSFLCPTARLN